MTVGLWLQWPSAVQGAVFYPLGGQGHTSQCWPESGPAPWLAWPQPAWPWPHSYRWRRHRATEATVAPPATPAHSCTMLAPRAPEGGASGHSGEIQLLQLQKFGDIPINASLAPFSRISLSLHTEIQSICIFRDPASDRTVLAQSPSPPV